VIVWAIEEEAVAAGAGGVPQKVWASDAAAEGTDFAQVNPCAASARACVRAMGPCVSCVRTPACDAL
jgi:hypothetical protein